MKLRTNRTGSASSANENRGSARLPALDGLRAVAILMVVGYHVDKSVVPAGHWGVTVFLVLSGYVVTASLCSEFDRTGTVDVRSFYLKRGVRILPALLALCAAMAAWGTDPSKVLAALGLNANYARIHGAELDQLTHTWFIAVIVHFYLVWPLVIGAIAPRNRLRLIGALALTAIVWRIVAIAVLSPGWVYNATDTNAAALLVGSALAVAPTATWRGARWCLPILLGLTLLPAFGDTEPLMLWGGFVSLALSVGAVQHTISRPAWMEHWTLLRLAEVSFGIYLWHYVFVRADLPLWLAAVLTAVAAAISWRVIEQPTARWVARRASHARSNREQDQASLPVVAA